MSYGRVVTVLAAFALLLTGCGGGAEQAATEPAQQHALDAAACTELTDANLNLATATNGEQARAAEDVFGKHDPPADVVEAVDHIVAAGGVKFDGSDFDLLKDHVDPWVQGLCPE